MMRKTKNEIAIKLLTDQLYKTVKLLKDLSDRVYFIEERLKKERRNMTSEFKTPPPFVRCSRCDGKGYYIEIDFDCTVCNGTGWLPQYYTPKQYRDWIRWENDMPEYELPGETPVWSLEPLFNGIEIKWCRNSYNAHNREAPPPPKYIIISTIAGRPPADWRPE